MRMKKKSIVIIASVFLFCAASGAAGAGIVWKYFIHPEDFCFCSQPPAINSASAIPELVRLKKFLGIKEDIQISAVYDKVKKELVGIYKKKEASANALDGVYSQNDFISNGFILTEDGWIVTIIDISRNFKKESIVIVRGLSVYPVEKTIIDPYSNVVFIKISAKDLPSVKLGSLDDSNVGQNILAVSYANGIVPTNIKNIDWRLSQETAQFIESTEKISEFLLTKDEFDKYFGGGVVVNLDGDVIGIITNQKNDTNINTVISSNILQQAIDGVLQKEKISRPVLGIKYIDLSRAVGLKNQRSTLEKGILVWEAPLPSTPAGIAGIRAKDIITQIDGANISGIKSFSSIMQEHAVGNKTIFTILRDNKEIKIEVVLGKIT